MLTRLCALILFTILFHLFGSDGCVLKAGTQGLDRSSFTWSQFNSNPFLHNDNL